MTFGQNPVFPSLLEFMGLNSRFVRLVWQALLSEEPSQDISKFFVFILNGLGTKACVSSVVSYIQNYKNPGVLGFCKLVAITGLRKSWSIRSSHLSFEPQTPMTVMSWRVSTVDRLVGSEWRLDSFPLSIVSPTLFSLLLLVEEIKFQAHTY